MAVSSGIAFGDRRYYTPFRAAILRCGRDWRGRIRLHPARDRDDDRMRQSVYRE